MALCSAGGVYGLLPTVICRICFESQVNKWFAYVYEGYAKRPSKQNAYSEGLWVGHVERYGWKHTSLVLPTRFTLIPIDRMEAFNSTLNNGLA
jgi:hypothetical protein